MEGETGLINAVVSVAHSASQPANAGGETFLVPKTIQVTMNGLAIALRNVGEVVGFDTSESERRIQPKTRPSV